MAGNWPRAFLDANIFLDVLQTRRNWESSLRLINFVREEKVSGCVSALTVAILYFLCRRERLSDSQSRRDVEDSIFGFDILGLDKEHVTAALDDKRFSDFEDVLQFHSAKEKATVIVTRNKRDFARVSREIEVLAPEEISTISH